MRVGLGRCGVRAGEEEGLRPDLGLDRVRCDDGRAEQVACGRLARGGIDEVMKLSAAPPPGSPVPSRGCQAAPLELERQFRRDGDRPPDVAQSDVAACVHEARAGGGQDRRSVFGGVALADAAEVEPDAAIELDAIPVDPDCAAARGSRRRRGAVRGELGERAVIPGLDYGVVDGGVEAAFGRCSPCEREADDLEQVGACFDVAVPVEPRELRAGVESRQQPLEPVELRFRGVELRRGAVGVDDQLDIGAHRLEAPPGHDELVAVAAGWLTI